MDLYKKEVHIDTCNVNFYSVTLDLNALNSVQTLFIINVNCAVALGNHNAQQLQWLNTGKISYFPIQEVVLYRSNCIWRNYKVLCLNS